MKRYTLTPEAVQMLDRMEALLSDPEPGGDQRLIAEAKQFFEVDSDEQATNMLTILVAVANGADTAERIEGFMLGFRANITGRAAAGA